MKTIRTTLSILVVIGAAIATGCSSLTPHTHQPNAESAAQLWASTCSHCHTLRPADQYSAEDWPLIVQHMRTRSGITASEAVAISRLLQGLAAD